MSDILVPRYYNVKIDNKDWQIYMGGERYFPAYPVKRTEPEPEYPNYLTFEALEDGEIGWWTNPDSDVEVHIFWSKDKENWTEFTQNDDTADYISVSSGENLYCRGINLDGVSGQYALDNDACNGFTQNSGKWNIKGNVMSLIDYNNMATMTEMVGNFFRLFSDDDGFKRGNTIDIVNAIDFVLPATTLASWCYQNMFKGCTSLTTAPVLPATTLERDCYNSMFTGCISLTTAPELPATTLAYGCYSSMFRNCNNLTTAPELPATTLEDSCYAGMFAGCVGLTTAPVLPAATLADGCYAGMFNDCSSLTAAPELPATTLAFNCYAGMFAGCVGLTTAPSILPATTLEDSCYQSMFTGCISLTTAPELPATTLEDSCYQNMFTGCISLTTAPELPATTLVDYCYIAMFGGCSRLNYIKCLAVNGINQNRSTYRWVYGVQTNSGTFIKHLDATDWTTGYNGIPNNWTVEDV